MLLAGLIGYYELSLVSIDGAVVARAIATIPTGSNCSGNAIPVSASNTRIYFMDHEGVVRFLAPNGSTRQVTILPASTADSATTFAVSPDDKHIAVIVGDCRTTNENGLMSTTLYVEDLIGGGNHVEIFSDRGPSTLRAIGWRGTGDLVVAKVPAYTQGGQLIEFHVVDPTTAMRRFTVGGPSCPPTGPPSPAGVVCGRSTACTFPPESDVPFHVVNWTGAVMRSFQGNRAYCGPDQGRITYLSPDGKLVAVLPGNDTLILETNQSFKGIRMCGWIDDTHVFSSVAIGDLTTGETVPIPAAGDCVARIPGGL